MTETTFRRLEGSSWVRDHVGEITSGGYALVVHVVNAEDDSPCHSTYRTGYDSRCGWCYLGANHSTAEHARKVAEAVSRLCRHCECYIVPEGRLWRGMNSPALLTCSVVLDGRDQYVNHAPTVTEQPKARPCKPCASVGRFTWLDDDGTCRREDAHR